MDFQDSNWKQRYNLPCFLPETRAYISLCVGDKFLCVLFLYKNEEKELFRVVILHSPPKKKPQQKHKIPQTPKSLTKELL